jgi:site-specific recombinase XerD
VRGTRLARGTVLEYRADLTHFAGSLRRRSLLTATATDVASWFHHFMRDDDDPADHRRWSLRTAHRRRAALHGFYRWAQRERLIAANPVDTIELPRFYRRPPRLVSLSDIERVFTYAESRLAAADPRDRPHLALDVAVLRLMERLALRVSEAAGIRISRLTSVNGELQAWISKKGRKPNAYPITGVVASAFVRWLATRSTIHPDPGHEDFVFIHPTTHRRVTRNQIQVRLRTLARAAGLVPATVAGLSPHKLRHARARAMLASGWHIAAVQAVLDHASIETTQVYVEDAENVRLDTLRALSTQDAMRAEPRGATVREARP